VEEAQLTSHPEIGRELAFSELQVRTIYVLIADTRPLNAVTLWFVEMRGDFAVFKAGEIGMMLLLKPNERGELFDGNGTRIRAYEYLGAT
jgi:hypothetical protein